MASVSEFDFEADICVGLFVLLTINVTCAHYTLKIPSPITPLLCLVCVSLFVDNVGWGPGNDMLMLSPHNNWPGW